MAIPKILGGQTDFSAGELDVTMKRADDSPVKRAGARQMSNWRILNSKAVSNRPGRSALYFETGRVERVLMSSGNYFDIVFGDGYLRVYNALGTQVFTSTVKGDGSPIPWTVSTVNAISYGVIGLSVYIAYTAGYPSNVPQVLSWDGTSISSGWTLSTYAETVTSGGQKRTPFYRISPTNITLLPSGITGAINITFSANVLQSAMIGTRISYCGRQMTIATVTSPTTGTATVNETLLGSETLPFGSSPAGIFNVGDVVTGSISGAKGIVLSVAALSIVVQLIPPAATFLSTDIVAGPGGSLQMNAGASAGAPGAVATWSDEVMNSFRGYPQSVFVDQGRLGFTNFPGSSVPGGIVWSSIGVYTDIWVDPLVATGSTASAIFEIAPGKSQVYYVVPGMESSEFVFCDNAIYFIPISVQSPLVPGSVQFTQLSSFGSQPNVQPRLAEQAVIYVKAGGLQVGAIQAPGAYNRPFIIDSISDNHSHLFINRNVLSIAIPSQSTQYEELYIYIAFSDGGLVVGRYAMRNGLLEQGGDGKPNVGWLPWSSAGRLLWLSAFQSTVLMTSSYNIAGSLPYSIIEQLDASRYLDSALLVNSLPAAIAAQKPIGKGPLWFIAGGTVTLMDGTPQLRMMGTYQVDANGNIVPQGNAGENLTSGALLAGQPWTAIIEPFVPDANPGNSVHQRMFKRRVSRMAVYVSQSTGFLMARLFSGPITRTSPALGTIMNTYRVTTWNQDDDPTQNPPLREEAQRWRPLGRAYDPRVAVIKDTPGPLIVHEFGIEASI